MRSTLMPIAICLCTLWAFSHAPVVAYSPAPYIMFSAPYPDADWGVLGIVPGHHPTQAPTISNMRATSLAKFAHKQFRNVKQWHGMDVFVFKDKATAEQFAKYQAQRRSRKLTVQDYRRLSRLWPKTQVFASFPRNKREAVIRYPQQNPRTWWRN